MEKRIIGGAGIFLAALLFIFQETVRFLYQQALSHLYAAFGGDAMTVPAYFYDPISVIAILLAVFGLAAILWNPILNLTGRHKKHTKVKLTIVFPGTPREIGNSNLWHWSWFWIDTQFQCPNNGPNLRHVASLFIWVFDTPVHYRQIKITGNNMALPPYEVKQRTARHCVVSFLEKVPDGEIEFELIH